MADLDHDRIHLPASPACGRWETMLVDALDNQLSAEDQAFFEQHRAVCPNCSALYDQSSCGRQWLACLEPSPEPAADLVERILRHAGPGLFATPPVAAAAGVVAMPPVWQQPSGRLAWLRRFTEPRLMMTAAMAFFSIALTLSLTRAQLRAVHATDINPGSMRAALERRIATASTPVVRYYDHLRLLYEIESRVHEMQQHSTGSAPAAQPGKSGGSQLLPGDRPDPRTAPQQTVNPPLLIESADPMEDQLEATLQPGPEAGPANNPETDLHAAAYLAAIPERSQPCSA